MKNGAMTQHQHDVAPAPRLERDRVGQRVAEDEREQRSPGRRTAGSAGSAGQNSLRASRVVADVDVAVVVAGEPGHRDCSDSPSQLRRAGTTKKTSSQSRPGEQQEVRRRAAASGRRVARVDAGWPGARAARRRRRGASPARDVVRGHGCRAARASSTGTPKACSAVPRRATPRRPGAAGRATSRFCAKTVHSRRRHRDEVLRADAGERDVHDRGRARRCRRRRAGGRVIRTFSGRTPNSHVAVAATGERGLGMRTVVPADLDHEVVAVACRRSGPSTRLDWPRKLATKAVRGSS